MTPLFDFSPSQIQACLLIFARIGAILHMAPIFSSPRMPVQLRAGVSLLLAVLLLPVAVPHMPEISPSLAAFVLLLLREILFGLAIGYIASLIFSVVEMAGEMQDTQAGFGFAGVVDPNMGQPSAILGQFQMVLMWLIFLTVNGHHVLLQAIADSFHLVPLGEFTFNPELTRHMMGLVTTLMVIAVKISAPVIGAVLLADLALGTLQRTAPQLNIIAVGFPIKIAVALIIVGLALPFILSLQRDLVHFMGMAMRDGMLLGQ